MVNTYCSQPPGDASLIDRICRVKLVPFMEGATDASLPTGVKRPVTIVPDYESNMTLRTKSVDESTTRVSRTDESLPIVASRASLRKQRIRATRQY